MVQIEQRWSTRLSQGGKALSYWKEVICDNLLSMQIDSANEKQFFGQIDKFPFGPLNANFIENSEQKAWRDRNARRDVHENRFHLIHVRKGIQQIEQYGRNLVVGAGDCVLVDCMAGFSFRFPEGVEALVMEVPRDWLRGWVASPEDAAARVIDGKTGWGATLASALSNITLLSIGSLGLPSSVVAEQIAVLLALAAVPMEVPAPTTHKRGLIRRVQEILRERCHEQNLDPASVAGTLGVSRRYIHVLFASAGTTFTQVLYDCRLKRAQRLLEDKRFDGVGIAEIGWNCGFSEPSHFTRRFRERFGVPPATYRAGASR